jgi:integrase
MQRRRVQRGSIFLRKGKFQTILGARYLEPVSDAKGQVRMVHRSRVLGVAQTHNTPGLTKREAQKLLDEILRPMNEDHYVPTTEITFEEFYRKWEATKLPAIPRESTRRFYRDTIHGWILPYFRIVPLAKIQPIHVQDFINRFKDKFSDSTLKHIRSGLNQIFNTAVRWEYLTKNPAAGLSLPEGKKKVQAQVFEAHQIAQLYGALVSPYREMVLLMAVTGMRESELFGLKKQDFDVGHLLIHIRQCVYKRRVGPPKTDRSARPIRVLPEVFEPLKPLLCGQPTDFVFHGGRGGFMRGDEIMKDYIRPTAEKLGLSRITWRYFRRSGASTMDNNGVTMKTKQTVLGHTNPNITMMYIETNEAKLAEAAEVLGRPFFPILSQKEVTNVVQ